MGTPWHQSRRSTLISDIDETALHFIEATYRAGPDSHRHQDNVSLLSYYLQRGYIHESDSGRAYNTIRNLQEQIAGG